MGAEKHKLEVYGLVTDHKFHQAKVTAEVGCLKFEVCFYISHFIIYVEHPLS